MAVRSDNRFKNSSSPCPVCGGWDSMHRGAGQRCGGFLSDDGKYAHCTREDHSGGLLMDGAKTFSHYLNGQCKCGVTHRAAAPVIDINIQRGPTAVYEYPNEKRTLLYQACRFVSPNGEKTFRLRRPPRPDDDPSTIKNGWVWNLKETRRVPYRLPELLEADLEKTVFIVEGEKDVDNLWKLGYVATCNSEGAGNWRPEFGPFFTGRNVIIIPDNDEPGQKHAGMVLASVYQAARSAKVLNLEGLPPKGDVSDWLAAGHKGEELLQLALHTPTSSPTVTPTGRPRPTIISARALAAKDFAPLEYIIPGILPTGTTLLAAKPKLGKSWMGLGAVVAVAAGGVALSQKVKIGEALYLALEDNLPRLKRRLLKVCPNGIPAGLEFATDWTRSDLGGLEDLETYIQEHPKLKLVVIDTLQKWRKPASGRDNIYNADYEALDGLTRLAGKYSIAIIIIAHTRKGTSEDPLEEVSGSNGLTGAVDNALILRRDRGQADAVMHRIGRDLEDDSPLALKFDAFTAAWTVIGSAEEHAVSKERQEIYDLLKKYPAGLTPSEVAQALGKNRIAAQYLLTSMAEAKQVIQEGFRGKYKLTNSTNFTNSVNSTNFTNSETEWDEENLFNQTIPTEDSKEVGKDSEVSEVSEVYDVVSNLEVPAGLCWSARISAQNMLKSATVAEIGEHLSDNKGIIEAAQYRRLEAFANQCKQSLAQRAEVLPF